MTNTREEVAVAEAIYYATGDMPRAIPFEQSCQEALICRKQAKAAIAASNSKYVAGLVEALKRIAESEYDYETGQHSDEIAEEALNNLPEELRG